MTGEEVNFKSIPIDRRNPVKIAYKGWHRSVCPPAG